jgi:hypothetical protein
VDDRGNGVWTALLELSVVELFPGVTTDDDTAVEIPLEVTIVCATVLISPLLATRVGSWVSEADSVSILLELNVPKLLNEESAGTDVGSGS